MSSERSSRRDFIKGMGVGAGGLALLGGAYWLGRRSATSLVELATATPEDTGRGIEPLQIEASYHVNVRGVKALDIQGPPTPLEIMGPNETQFSPRTSELVDMSGITPFNSIGKYGDPKFLPEGFELTINLGGRVVADRVVRTAYILWSNDFPGLDRQLAPFSLATLTTESGDMYYISTGFEATMGNFVCANKSVTRAGQLAELKKIAGWLGGFEVLAGPAQEILDMWPSTWGHQGWKITGYDNFPSSSCGAIGSKQFLPETWTWMIGKYKSAWKKEQIDAFLNRGKELGLIREEVNDLTQLHPMIVSEAMIGGILFMQLKGIKTDGTNFSRWNADTAQGKLAVERYKAIKEAFLRVGQMSSVEAKSALEIASTNSIGERAVSFAATLIGKYPYGARSQQDGSYNPGTGYYVCTDLVTVSFSEAGSPIARDAYQHNSLRLVGTMISYFKGNNYQDTNNRIRSWHNSGEEPEVGWAIFFDDSHTGIISEVLVNGNQAVIKTIEATGISFTDPKQNIINRQYNATLGNGIWKVQKDSKGRSISGYGEVFS